ncbi:MAG: dihydropteroate synthase [Kiritimatiellae bacterium]|nr:dihydropteroate synthase [Kiritimatiellia bacterium]
MGIVDQRKWNCRGRQVAFDPPAVMGIVNVTPDSFSDGGQHATTDAAVDHALRLVREGAAIVDIGGMSTRPGAADVSVQEEIDRVVPVVRRLVAACDVTVSVDTFRAEVARAALAAGAHAVNDVLPFDGQSEMAAVVREYQAGLVVMHSRGTPRSMDGLTAYSDLVAEVEATLDAAVAFAERNGISRDQVVIDPGLGFAKTVEQNLELLRATARFAERAPVLIGASRKRFVGAICGVEQACLRDAGSHACALFAISQGASIVRVHDVKGMVESIKMWRSLC